MASEYRDIIRDLTGVIKAIVWGDSERIRELFRYTADTRFPEDIAQLAEQIGTLIVQKEYREFQLETLIEKHIQTQQALEEARHDPLTGLPNRALFLDLLEKQCSSSLAAKENLAVLFIDFDKFKKINDTFGHAAGDELLILGSQRIVNYFGDHAVTCRLGGDEFAVFVRESEMEITDDAILALLDRMRAPFSLTVGQICLSVSIGVTHLPEEGRTAAGLLKNADVAMYRAKSAGRNGFTRYHPIQIPILPPPEKDRCVGGKK